jgi:hypothetical protein
MSSLDLSSNRIGGSYQDYGNTGSGYGDYKATPEGPKAIARAIKDMGAMTSLNLASNNLCGINEFGDGVYDASGTACSIDTSCLV